MSLDTIQATTSVESPVTINQLSVEQLTKSSFNTNNNAANMGKNSSIARLANDFAQEASFKPYLVADAGTKTTKPAKDSNGTLSTQERADLGKKKTGKDMKFERIPTVSELKNKHIVMIGIDPKYGSTLNDKKGDNITSYATLQEAKNAAEMGGGIWDSNEGKEILICCNSGNKATQFKDAYKTMQKEEETDSEANVTVIGGLGMYDELQKK